MKQILIRNGKIELEDVPAPGPRSGWVLVQNAFSCVSPGTETASLGSAVEKVARDPKRREQALSVLTSMGVRRFVDLAIDKLNQALPLGYSSAGVVLDPGGIEGLDAGMRVACVGSGWASHAEIVSVPHNLCTTVPEGVSLRDASTVALGAIAVQGVRRAALTLGEFVFVIGLGVLGQITCRLALSSGCRVIAVDLNPDRVKVAESAGVDWASINADAAQEKLFELTGGAGADAVIVTAASKSNEVVSLACRAARRKGRVVIVGDVGLAFQRADLYVKELDVLMSTSYGPGRYDPAYEEKGSDYPYAYVRWTAQRNMAAYLDEITRGRIRLDELSPVVTPLASAPKLYERLKTAGPKPLLPLISYPATEEAMASERVLTRTLELSRKHHRKRPSADRVRIGLIGAGSFVRGMHLPNLRRLQDLFEVRAICTRTGHDAAAIARRYGACFASTDVDELLGRDDIDAVLVGTRHNTHAMLVKKALSAGKHVLVEKPLCMNREELEEIRMLRQNTAQEGLVMTVGFNRRFSPYLRRLKAMIQGGRGSCVMRYRMNVPPPEAGHWSVTAEGGGKNLGEACHIYDVFTYLVGAGVLGVQAVPLSGSNVQRNHKADFIATVAFDDGSIASLVYTTQGNAQLPKEHMELFVSGCAAVLEDYSVMWAYEGGRREKCKHSGKGHLEELRAFGEAILGRRPQEPTDEEIFQAMDITFRVEEQI